MINKLIKKMQDGKKQKKKQEMDYLKHKIQTLESKVLMRSLERNQMDFMNSMKKGNFAKKKKLKYFIKNSTQDWKLCLIITFLH